MPTLGLFHKPALYGWRRFRGHPTAGVGHSKLRSSHKLAAHAQETTPTSTSATFTLPLLATTNELVAISAGNAHFCVSWHPARLLTQPYQARDLPELISRYYTTAYTFLQQADAGMHLVLGPIDCLKWNDESDFIAPGKAHIGTHDPYIAAQYHADEACIDLGRGYIATYHPFQPPTTLDPPHNMWELALLEQDGLPVQNGWPSAKHHQIAVSSDPWKQELLSASAAAHQRSIAAAVELCDVLSDCKEGVQQLLRSGLLRDPEICSETNAAAEATPRAASSQLGQQHTAHYPPAPQMLPEALYSTRALLDMAALEGANLQFVLSMEQEAMFHGVASLEELAAALQEAAQQLEACQAAGGKLLSWRNPGVPWHVVEVGFGAAAVLAGCPVAEARLAVSGEGVVTYVWRGGSSVGVVGSLEEACWRSFCLDPCW